MNDGRLFYGRKIVAQEKGKRPVFSNVACEQSIVGEILLEKCPPDSICNICLQKKELTKDHVPPKCAGNTGRMRYQCAINEILANDPFRGLSQNGIQFRTICGDCNQLLCKYDMEIEKLFTQAKAHIALNGFSPTRVHIKPNAIIRGFCGHFLSSKTTHQWSGLDEHFSLALLHQGRPISHALTFYVAPYDNRQVRVFRDLIFCTPKGPIPVYFVKTYPFAFFLTGADLFKLPKWTEYLQLAPDSEQDVTIFDIPKCAVDWPDNANYFNMPILHGKTSSESVIAVPDPLP